MSENKEKLYIAGIIFFDALALFFAVKASKKIEVRFSKPVSRIGNFVAPDRQDIWQQK